MNADSVSEKLRAILKEYAEDANKPIRNDSNPLDDVPGFESDFIPEVVRKLARELFGKPLPKGTRVKNIFVEKGRKLSVDEVAKKFLATYAPKGVKA